jgi:hypothetical protein
MKILLDTQSTDPDFNGDCDYAVVDMTPALAQQIHHRVELARQAGRQDDDLCELYFWGGTAEFYDSSLFDACQDAVAASADGSDADQAVRNWLADLDHNGHAVLPEGVDLTAYTAQRTECDQFIVRCSPSSHNPTFEIAWTAIPKHSDVYIQGQRSLSSFSGKDLQQEIDAPSCHATLHDVALFARMLLDQAQCQAA